MPRRATALTCLASLVGCVTTQIRTTPADLEAARHLLREGKPAPVKSQEHGTIDVRPTQRVEIVDLQNKRFDLRVDELVRDCAVEGKPAEANRLCELHNVQHVVLGTDRKVHEGVYMTPIAFVVVGVPLAAIIGVGYCASECDGYKQTASQVGVGALVVLALYALGKHGFAR